MLNYSLIIVNDKRIVRHYKDYEFPSKEVAQRFLFGVFTGLRTVGKKWGVVMLLNDVYDNDTSILLDVSSKQSAILFDSIKINEG